MNDSQVYDEEVLAIYQHYQLAQELDKTDSETALYIRNAARNYAIWRIFAPYKNWRRYIEKANRLLDLYQ